MGIDLNDAVPLEQALSFILDLNNVEAFFDFQEFNECVRAQAPHWVPVLYPSGRLSADRREWRVADPTGRAPRKQGSFVVQLYGSNAGTGYEHDGRTFYGAEEMVEAARPHDDAIAWLAEQVGMEPPGGYVSVPRARVNPSPAASIPAPRDPDRYAGDVALLLSKCEPAKGSPVEDYFRARGIPLPDSDDLKYCADITDHAAKRGYEGMVAIVRAPDGTPMKGVHRTMLHDDFREDEKAKHKKMLAECAGGAVRLAPIGDDGCLAISEGIESGAAAMWLHGQPTWATLSAGGMKRFDVAQVPGLKFLTIYTDAGDAGLEAAHEAANAAMLAGIPGEIVRPLSDDDFAKDVKQGERPGLTRADAQVIHRWEATPTQSNQAESRTDVIERINSEFAFVLVGGKSTVIREMRDDEGRPLIVFMNKDSFHDWLAPEFITMKDGNRKQASRVWWTDARRRQYSGLVFAPEGASDRFYNMWRGFPIQAKPGKCDLFLNHVRDNICKGDKALFAWLEAWMAQMFQKPHIKPGTCVVLRGRHGTGKSKVGDILRSMTYPHDTKISKGRHLTGNFNAHLKHTLFLQVEEGFWAGDKAAEGVLKDLITADEQQLEMKGKDVESIRNLMRVLITSNHDWVVPAAMDERRFAIFDVGDDHRKDYAYFKAIDDQMKSGGREALLYHFLHLDIGGVNLREVPQTQGLVEQKLRSMTPEQAWWFDCLERGAIIPGELEWPEFVGTERAYQSYVDRAQALGQRFRPSSAMFVRDHWRKMVPALSAHKEHRVSGYKLPALSKCREMFESMIGGKIEWPEE